MAGRTSVLILNPTSGLSPLAANHGSQESSLEYILAALEEHGIEPEILYTSEEDHGEGVARRAAEAGTELVIVAGGDGTLHAVASGLAGTQATVGIIPLGTMNNVAHSLKIPEDIDEACEIIARGTTRLIDTGTINGQIFLEVAGIGLEAAIFPAAEEIKKVGIWSTLRGIVHGLRVLLRFWPTRFVASFDGRRIRRFRAIQISVCNSPYYGARLQFAPKAVMDDGFLDVLIYKNFSTLKYLRHALSISQGRRTLEPEVTRRKIKSLRLSAEEPVPIHADGIVVSSHSIESRFKEEVAVGRPGDAYLALREKGAQPGPAYRSRSEATSDFVEGTRSVHVSVQPGVLRVRVPQKVANSPNVVSPQEKNTRRYQQTRCATQEEKGSLHVP